MLSEDKWKQYGLPDFEPKGIVIHNTNNQLWSAKRIEEFLQNENQGSNGCHYVVDHKEVRQIMPLEWSSYSTGMGTDFGNTHCIAIEICSNPSNRLYLQGQDRAIKLIRKLMKKYHLTTDDIFFHRDFCPNINCPAQILKLYGSKANFLASLKGTDILRGKTKL